MSADTLEPRADAAPEARLRRLLLSGHGDPAFDRLARLAAQVIGTPVALVTILDADRQFFKSCLGLPEPWQTWRETDLAHSFCRYVVETGGPLVIEDAREDPLVSDNPAIRDLNIIAYLGIPLELPNGAVLGAFCVIDTRPRKWTTHEIEVMQGLTSCVVTQIELQATALEAREQAEAARKEHSEKEAVQQARREAETALTLLDTIYQSAPIALALIDPDLTFDRINAAAAAAAGKPVAALIHRCVRDAAPELWAQIEVPLRRALESASGETVEIVTAGTADEPSRRWLAGLYPVHSPGASRSVSLAMVEITALKAAARALARSEQRYRSLFDLNPDAVFAISPEGRFIAANPACERISGYPPAQLLQRSWMELVAPEELSRDLEYFRRALSGEAHQLDMAILHREGRRVDLSVTTVPMREDEEIVGVFGIAEDVTYARRAEESLRRQNQTLVALGKNPVVSAGDLDQALQVITVAAAGTLGVRRVGIWHFDETRTRLTCRCLFLSDEGRHTAGQTVSVETYPDYFQALEEDRVIAAHDAGADSRTCELDRSYLSPLNIGALLDAPIHQAGRLVGVVCHEHVGPARQWTAEEQSFAAGIADMVALAYEHAERRWAEQALDEARERLLRKEVEKREFTRELLRAVTRGKLRLTDARDVPDEGPWLCQLSLDVPTHYRLFRRRLSEAAHNAGMAEADAGEVLLAAGEAISNAIKHGVNGRASLRVTPEKIVVRVEDGGPGIRTEDLPATLLEAGYSTKISLGVGFTLLLQLVDVLWLATGPSGTIVQFERRLCGREQRDPVAALMERFSGPLEATAGCERSESSTLAASSQTD